MPYTHGMPRPETYTETIQVRLPPATLERIEAVRGPVPKAVWVRDKVLDALTKEERKSDGGPVAPRPRRMARGPAGHGAQRP
jgi:hypothetical protein